MYAPESDDNDRVYCKNGGFLDRLPPFSASEYGMMPRDVDGAEPEHHGGEDERQQRWKRERSHGALSVG